MELFNPIAHASHLLAAAGRQLLAATHEPPAVAVEQAAVHTSPSLFGVK
jgi:hypothetical protein